MPIHELFYTISSPESMLRRLFSDNKSFNLFIYWLNVVITPFLLCVIRRFSKDSLDLA